MRCARRPADSTPPFFFRNPSVPSVDVRILLRGGRYPYAPIPPASRFAGDLASAERAGARDGHGSGAIATEDTGPLVRQRLTARDHLGGPPAGGPDPDSHGQATGTRGGSHRRVHRWSHAKRQKRALAASRGQRSPRGGVRHGDPRSRSTKSSSWTRRRARIGRSWPSRSWQRCANYSRTTRRH